ncbi:D-2-hydroxyacid dehydrogenase [Sutcliffiella rhizosphaerae]|uniref:Glyoxylate/hydroxypyruvate reductase A n=1 Tax=Sutcliffiella rhizosphaerae TaxID=2880967 RepID=A0ABN8A4F8_9BACI|nr:D-2-hydroxyacid dehydrogenase [Sutcliffiella rhizosphaerae]CAG9619965.1 Glyoxylate/hydroxypyruvate reductase A [Sutcliffiella rhizosphaerae]
MKIENILVTGRIYQELKELIPQRVDKNMLFLPEKNVKAEDLEWADAYVAFQPTANFHFGNLKWVHSLGAGVDRYLDLPSWKSDVLLTRTITSFGQRIGEFVLSHILHDLQHHKKFQQQQLTKKWQVEPPKLLCDINVIIYGTGEIGQEVARILSFFNVTVYGISISGEAIKHFSKVMKSADRALLQQVDYVINTLPLTPMTNHFFDSTFFEVLWDTTFINVGRGMSVQVEDLLRALEKGYVKRAVLDVFEIEPLPSESPLWTHSKITITPHISAITTPEEAVECFLQTLQDVENEQLPKNSVDLQKNY